MEFRILGPLEVVDDGRAIPIDRRLSRALLAYLLLHANEPVSSERLVDRLWGEKPPKTAVASLQNYVSRLRKSIGAERLRLEPAGYVLRIDPERFDLSRFDRLVAEAERAPAKERAEVLRAAISLWRGEPLSDLAFEEFAQAEIAQLSERLLAAIENRIAAELELGRGPDLVDELEGLIAAHPLRERLRAQLMLALYRAGRQAEALDAYRDGRRMLQDELGLDPSDDLRTLQRRILEQDPALFTAAAVPAPVESRRTVTILFCDVVDSTRLAVTLDPEAYRRLMSAYYEAAKRAVESHGGTVEKFIGDAVVAVFGMPELHEDDALRGVRAAVDVRAAIDDLQSVVPLRVRIAVNTGEVVTSVEADRPHITGAPISLAAHLEKHAGADEIVLGEKTYTLVQEAIRSAPVDLGDGLLAHRLDELVAGQPDARAHAPLVGRRRELRRLRTAFHRAKKEQACAVVTVLGEAGIGKTRLTREFVASTRGEARVLVGRCVAYGAGATYIPIADVVRQVAPQPSQPGIAALLADEDDGDRVAQRVAELVGFAEGAAAPGEAFWAIRRLLEALAREKPLVVVFDDLHWAESTLLDLVEYLGGWAEGPILVLGLARRELLESRPSWSGPTSTGTLVELKPLARDDVRTLVLELAEGAIAPDAHERIVDRAGGNPLFAEQLLALAAEAPELSLDETPPSVEALIAARLERLEPRELGVLRRASVLGRVFARGELEDLAAVDEADLQSLARRALIHSMETGDRLRFHHVLVREVAYRGIAKAERAELHERVANSLSHRDGADEIIGYHLEQSYLYGVAVGLDGDRVQALAAAAGGHLGRAGIRAWKRADVSAATNLLRRGVALLPVDDPSRGTLLCELGVALRGVSESSEAVGVLEEAIRIATDSGDRRTDLRARLELAQLEVYLGLSHGAAAVEALVDSARSAIPTFEDLADDRSLGRAWAIIGFSEGNFRLRYAACEQAVKTAIGYYRSAGWSPSTPLATLVNALYYGPCPVAEAVASCEQLLGEHAGDPASEANIVQWLGGLEAMIGLFDSARARISHARALYENLGLQLAATEGCALVLADIETLAGRIELAEQHLREACEVCLRFDESALLASRAAQLADALYVLGEYDEAQSWTQISRERTDAEDLHAESSCLGVESRLAARRGDVRMALRLIDQAREIMDRTDAVNLRAKLEVDGAEVCRLARRDDDARRALGRAIALYEEKGNSAAAGSARLLLETSVGV